MICDFCFSGNGRHRHVAEDASLGWWIACDHCDALIAEGNRYGLTTRGVTMLRDRIDRPGYSVDAVRSLHDLFWDDRDATVGRFTELVPEAVPA